VWVLDGRATQKRAAKLLPGDGRDERIAKYQRHLHSLLTSTLHELERLQARRGGEAVPPPAVADVNVTVEAAPGRTARWVCFGERGRKPEFLRSQLVPVAATLADRWRRKAFAATTPPGVGFTR
jgi:hypothetical protein